jgi:5-methyltetrahydrofolate--homocysteine methyltransferase
MAENAAEQQRLRDEHSRKVQQQQATQPTGSSPLSRRFSCDWPTYCPATPPFIGTQLLPEVPLCEILPLINWKMFYFAWKVKAETEEGRKLRDDADQLLRRLQADRAYAMRCLQAFFPAKGGDDHISIQPLSDSPQAPGPEKGLLVKATTCACCRQQQDIILPTPRQNLPEGTCRSLCDYVSPDGNDHIGLFAATVSQAFIDRLETLKREQGNTDYDALLMQTLGDRLVEAASEWMHRRLDWPGIRPAVGYSCLPDQKAIFQLARLIDFSSVGITLTENGAMYPQASVCGLYIGHPQAEYFPT